MNPTDKPTGIPNAIKMYASIGIFFSLNLIYFKASVKHTLIGVTCQQDKESFSQASIFLMTSHHCGVAERYLVIRVI